MNENKKNCIFCKIIKREIPADIIYEDDKFLGFLDIRPATKGHSLLIPKEHYEWIQDTPDRLISGTFITANKLIRKIKKALNSDYVQLVVVGKDVPHLHIHLIPRMLNDELPEYINTEYENEEEVKLYSNKIKNTVV